MKTYKLLLGIIILFLFTECNGQKNPVHIGKQFGVFDIDKVSFDENLDSLFSKVAFLIQPRNDSYFDTIRNVQVWTDIIDYTYRISPQKKIAGLFCFKNVSIKKSEVVGFIADKNKKFRRVDFAAYISTEEYNNLLANCKDYIDITPEEVKKYNDYKYIILQQKTAQKQTNLYCLKNDDKDGDYFIRVRVNDLRIRNDKFDKAWNSEHGY